jgi:thiol-disulfide isomerase/thioredoxin
MPRLPLLSLTLPVALLAGGCDRESAGDAQQQENSVAAKADASAEELTGTLDRSHAGEPIPAVTVTDPSGASLALAETRGKPVLLNLWATWCAPCVTEMPLLDRLAADLGDGVRVLTVSEDMKGAELVAPFFAERDLPNLPQWMDPKNDLAFAFDGGASLPLTVLYDAEGKEVWRVLGGYDWSSAEARTLIEEALPAT